jgi:restriction system protein
MSKAWIVRSGRMGERESWAIENAVAGGGFSEVGSLEKCDSREDVRLRIASSLPNSKPRKVTNFASQLWALKSRIQIDDLIVMPLKSSKAIAIGKCAGPYNYRDDADPSRRHSINVKWLRLDVPRSVIKQDLLYSLGAFMTICEVERNDAAWRLEQVLINGIDPGSRSPHNIVIANQHVVEADTDSEDLEVGEEIDIDAITQDAIRSHLIENFKGHQLSELTAAILRAQGLTCTVSPPGPDKGIDITVGSGPLGIDSPRIIVQCKSETGQVGSEVIQKLQGAIATTGADQGLLVAYGGVNKQARELLGNQQFKIKVWDADGLIEALLASYAKLDGEIQAEIPLKQVWTLVVSDD